MKNKRSVRLVFGIISLLFLINFVSAITCNPSFIDSIVDIDDTPSSVLMTCTNNNDFNVTLYNSGSFFSTSPVTPLIISNNSNEIFTVNFNQMTQAGSFNGFLYSSDGSTMNIDVLVEEEGLQQGVIVFPTAKVVNVQQGEEKNQNIQIIVPENYPESITIQSVSFSPDVDVIRFGDLDLGVLSPGQSINIPLIVDANEVQTGSYSTTIKILATNSEGQIALPDVNLQVVVSVGINPISNSTFSSPPSCSLSSTEFETNSTYQFTCTNTIDNIEINVPYNEYIEGTKVEYGGGTYKYYFKCKKLGNTNFIASFNYLGSSIFGAFEQEIRITHSGSSSVGGIFIKPQFFQLGLEKTLETLNAGDTVIIATDNKTGNLISNFYLYIDGQISNSTITLEADKVYNLRITSPSYNDLVISNLSVIETPIEIIINPDKSYYIVGDTLNITSNINGTNFLLDDVVITIPYTIQSGGNKTLKAVKQGYATTNLTLIVKDVARVIGCSPETNDWGKGDEVICELSKNTTWEVYFDGNLLTSGEGTKLEFEITEYGTYEIRSDGIGIREKSIVKTGFFNNLKWWHYCLGVVGLIGLVIGGLWLTRDADEDNLDDDLGNYGS